MSDHSPFVICYVLFFPRSTGTGTHFFDACGVESMKTLGGMKVLVAYTSLLVIHPHRKVRNAYTTGLFRLSRVLICL